MFVFRYIGHFDLNEPVIRVYEPVPNVSSPLSRKMVDRVTTRHWVHPADVRWYYGCLLTFLSLPGEVHPFEQTLMEDEGCSILNMRLERFFLPREVVSQTLADEIWIEDDYLAPAAYGWHWEDVLFERLIEPDRWSTCLQGQVMYALHQLCQVTSYMDDEEALGGGKWRPSEELEAAVHAYTTFLVSHLCDGTFEMRVNEFMQHSLASRVFARSDDEGDREWTRLVALAGHWCRLHPKPTAPSAFTPAYPSEMSRERHR